MMRHRTVLVATAAAILGVALLALGCDDEDVESADPATRKYDLAGSSRLDVSHAFDVEVTHGDAQEVSVTVDDNLIDSLDVRVEGGVLRIGLEDAAAHEGTTRKATVTLPDLTALDLSGASHAAVENFSSSGDLDVLLAEASSLVLTDVRAGDTRFDVRGASTVTGNVRVGDIWIHAREASIIDLEGSGAKAFLEASEDSHLRLGDFALRSAEVTLSGASTATLDVAGTLDADLGGASTLSYSGSPKLGKIETTGASRISPCLTPGVPGPVPIPYPSIHKGSPPPNGRMEGPPMSPAPIPSPASGDEPGVAPEE